MNVAIPLIALAAVTLSACSSNMINANHYNRPSVDFGVSFPHCYTQRDEFWNYVSNYQKGPETIEITYRRPVNASQIYRGDCSGDAHSCNAVTYKITDFHGNVSTYRADPFDPDQMVQINGTSISSIVMEGDVTGRGVDRQSGPVLPCPM